MNLTCLIIIPEIRHFGRAEPSQVLGRISLTGLFLELQPLLSAPEDPNTNSKFPEQLKLRMNTGGAGVGYSHRLRTACYVVSIAECQFGVNEVVGTR